MTPAAAAVRSRRVELRNRLWQGINTACVLHGVDPAVTPESVRAALRRIHATDPSSPVVCRVAGSPARWVPVAETEIDAWLDRLVIDGSDRAAEPLADTADHMFRQSLDGQPFVAVVGRGWVGLLVDHIFGDGGYIINNLCIGLLASAADGSVAEDVLPAANSVAHPLASTSWRRLVRRPDPATWGAVAGRARAGGSSRPPDRAVGEDAQPALGLVTCVGAPGSAAELRAWGKEHAPGVSSAVLVMAAARIALERAGAVAAATDSVVTYDLRRYLSPGSRTAGNFSGALRLRDPGCRDLHGMAAQLGRDAELALPLVSLLVATGAEAAAPVLSRLRRGGGAARPGPVVLTHLGSVAALRRLPWDPEASDRGVVLAAAPQELNGVTVISHEWKKCLSVAIAFDAGRVSRSDVQAAAFRLVEEPWALLEEGTLP